MSKSDQNPFYRSLEEKEHAPGFADGGPEFPTEKSWSRRDFLKAMGFTTTAAVVASCSPMPVEKAIPYLLAPESITPGKATWYASTCRACPSQCAILVKTREGRPIKIEGNPDSPLNRGGLCAVGQAGVLSLYDSGRLHGPLVSGAPSTWTALDERVRTFLREHRADSTRIRLLTGPLTGPTWLDVIARFQKAFPQTRHVVWETPNVSALLDAHESAFGRRLLPHFHFDRADVIVSLNADFLGTWISPVEFSKQYRTRRAPQDLSKISRHVQFESRLSLTGAQADRRILMKPSEERAIATGLLAAVTGATFSDSKLPVPDIVEALKSAKGRSLVVSGSADSVVQKTVAAINHALGNYGKTIELHPASLQHSGISSAVSDLISDMAAGGVDLLIVYGCNPAYENDDQLRWNNAVKNVSLVISLASNLDETATQAHLVAPDHHYLEAWSDAEPIRGLFHVAQPTINPIYNTRHAAESLLRWMGDAQTFEAAMMHLWSERMPHVADFWRSTLRKGFHQTASPPASDTTSINRKIYDDLQKSGYAAHPTAEFEIEIFESVLLRNGRHANNPWLQETPDPITKQTWGNAALISVADGKRLGLAQGDVVRLTSDTTTVELPVLLQPGQMSGTIAVALGYGRKNAGKVGTGVGANASPLSARRYVSLTKSNRHEELALTQIHYSLEGRPLVKDLTLTELQNETHTGEHELVMLWSQHESKDHAWGLAIDLSACTGCSGCLISCQAENNIAVVGKDEVRRQREMHWLRIDRYYKGDLENPDVVFEPMLCQHCGNAPCESVCPVLATVHSSDGLNQQIYNRCVGTRYCANNCPYKVRRFNWFDYANNARFDFHMNDDTGKLVLNPDVTVRSRGVMEKCSLCVQRIQEEKIKAKAAGKNLKPDDIQTACQQSCPTDAIVFGDRNQPDGRLAALLKKNPRAFQVLGELNVKPAVTYLAKVRNRP